MGEATGIAMRQVNPTRVTRTETPYALSRPSLSETNPQRTVPPILTKPINPATKAATNLPKPSDTKCATTGVVIMKIAVPNASWPMVIHQNGKDETAARSVQSRFAADLCASDPE